MYSPIWSSTHHSTSSQLPTPVTSSLVSIRFVSCGHEGSSGSLAAPYRPRPMKMCLAIVLGGEMEGPQLSGKPKQAMDCVFVLSSPNFYIEALT